MACMCVPPSWLVATLWLVPILLRSLVKVRGSSPRRGSSPLLLVPTPKGWKAEYTLASRMQIHESPTVLALLTRGEARTSDPWICSLMLYHLSYLTTTYIHTYIHTCMHTYIIHTYDRPLTGRTCFFNCLSLEIFRQRLISKHLSTCRQWYNNTTLP